MNVALVGLGRHGSRYAAHLLNGDIPGLRLDLVARGNAAAAREFASQHGVRAASDPLAAVTDPGIRAVILCIPPDLTVRYAIPALAAGKAVLVEKPLAADLAGARAIERKAEKGLLMVAQTLRFNSVVRAMSAAAGTIGPVHGFSTSQRYEPLPLPWIEDPERGGCLRVTGVHAFDLARHLTGAEVTRVSCQTIPGSDGASPVADHAFTALLRLEPGPILATVDNSRLSAGRCGRIELVGDGGSLVGDHVLGTLVRIHGGEATPLPVGHPVPTVRECLRAFAAAIRGEMPVAITATDGRRAVAITEACRRSARSHREIALRG